MKNFQREEQLRPEKRRQQREGKSMDDKHVSNVGDGEHNNPSRCVNFPQYELLGVDTTKNDCSSTSTTTWTVQFLQISLPNDATLLDIRDRHPSMEVCCDYLKKYSTELKRLKFVTGEISSSDLTGTSSDTKQTDYQEKQSRSQGLLEENQHKECSQASGSAAKQNQEGTQQEAPSISNSTPCADISDGNSKKGKQPTVPTKTGNSQPRRHLLHISLFLYRLELNEFDCLEHVDLGPMTAMTTIEERTFSHCSTLQTIELPWTLQEIDDGAFFKCSSLSMIQLPRSMKRIGQRAFQNCTSLVTVSYISTAASKQDPEFMSLAVEAGAFNGCCSLRTVQLPDSIKEIHDGTFQRCASLECIDFVSSNPNNTQQQFDDAIHSANESRPKRRRIMASAATTTASANWKTGIHFPPTIRTIGNCAFNGCSSLAKINLTWATQLRGLGEGTFQHCSSLTCIQLPPTMTETGKYTWNGCTSLTTIQLPSSIHAIQQAAFQNCPGLTSLIIPTGVAEFGFLAMADCTSLTSIDLANNLTIRTLTVATFQGCSGLKSVRLPKQLEEIQRAAFLECTSLLQIDIPNSVRVIGSDAFAECSALATVILPKSLNKLSQGVFQDCTGLTDVLTEHPQHHHSQSHVSLLELAERNNTNLPTLLFLQFVRPDIFEGCSNPRLVTTMKWLKFICDLNRGGRHFVYHRSGRDKAYPPSLWSLILYRILKTMSLHDDDDDRKEKDDRGEFDADTTSNKTDDDHGDGRNTISEGQEEGQIDFETSQQRQKKEEASSQRFHKLEKRCSIIYYLLTLGIIPDLLDRSGNDKYHRATPPPNNDETEIVNFHGLGIKKRKRSH